MTRVPVHAIVRAVVAVALALAAVSGRGHVSHLSAQRAAGLIVVETTQGAFAIERFQQMRRCRSRTSSGW